jgi:hypothetical protein
MTTSTQYRQYAEECVRLARAAATEHQHKVLLEMAQAWRCLAEQAERKRQEPTN